jgi:hypothetical protein
MVDLDPAPRFSSSSLATTFTEYRELTPLFGDEGSRISGFCARVQCRALALQILSIEQHEHFQHERGPTGLPNGVEAADHMRVWLKQVRGPVPADSPPAKLVSLTAAWIAGVQAQEKNRPREWLNQYLTFSLDPTMLSSLNFQSREVGYDLTAYRVPQHLSRFGENFVFNINALRLSMGNTIAESKLLEATAAANHVCLRRLCIH